MNEYSLSVVSQRASIPSVSLKCSSHCKATWSVQTVKGWEDKEYRILRIANTTAKSSRFVVQYDRSAGFGA